MAMTITPHDDTEFETSGRRRKITKFALAGVAVLGVGAALTSAAWTDNVWFQGNASTGNVDLRGSVNGTTWLQGASEGTPIVIPASELGNVGPDISDTTTIYVRNFGSLPVAISTTQAEGTGTLFEGTLPAGVVVSDWVEDGGDGVLLTGETASAVVTVTGNSWTGTEYQGASGTVTVQVEGTSDIP